MNVWTGLLLGIAVTLMIDVLATYAFIKKARKDQRFAESVVLRLAYLLKVPVAKASSHLEETLDQFQDSLEEEVGNSEYLN